MKVVEYIYTRQDRKSVVSTIGKQYTTQRRIALGTMQLRKGTRIHGKHSCWNIVYDSLLVELERIISEMIMAYADDLAAAIAGYTR